MIRSISHINQKLGSTRNKIKEKNRQKTQGHKTVLHSLTLTMYNNSFTWLMQYLPIKTAHFLYQLTSQKGENTCTRAWAWPHAFNDFPARVWTLSDTTQVIVHYFNKPLNNVIYFFVKELFAQLLYVMLKILQIVFCSHKQAHGITYSSLYSKVYRIG